MLVVAVSTAHAKKQRRSQKRMGEKQVGLLYRRQAAIISFGIHFPPPVVLLGIREKKSGGGTTSDSPPPHSFIHKEFPCGGGSGGSERAAYEQRAISEGSELNHLNAAHLVASLR